jgi:hypothetical protein
MEQDNQVRHFLAAIIASVIRSACTVAATS